MACGLQMAMGFASSLLLLFTFADTWLSAFFPLPVFTDRHSAGLDWLLVASSADGFCLFSAHFPLKFPYFPLISDEKRCYDSSARFLYSTLASMKDELCCP